MLRRRRIPDLAGEAAAPYHIKSLDGTYTNRKSTPDEWIVLRRPVRRLFWGILFRMLNILVGHQECLPFSVVLASRARYTSRMTAARMTQPVTNRRVGSCAPICASPAPSTAMSNTPKNVLMTEPRPPDKLAPPMTHAAMACNSAPAPAFGSAEDKRAHCKTAAQAASNPLRPNTATLIGRGLTPV